MENNVDLENIDKKLVNESVISFNRNNDIQSLMLTSDGIIERYSNGTLSGTFPFSKLGVVRECKSLVSDGYTLSWIDRGTGNLNEATITNPNNDEDKITLDNPEQVKTDLKKDIDDVKEIQDLKNELETELDKLNEEDGDVENYLLIVYTNVDGEFVPDVAIKSIEGTDYVVANTIDEAQRFTKELADHYVEEFNNPEKNGNQYILKSVKEDDTDFLNGLYESKEIITEELDGDFPTTEFTSKKLTSNELYAVNLEKDLSIEQVAWIEQNIGSLKAVEIGIKNFSKELTPFGDEPVISLDKYITELKNNLPF